MIDELVSATAAPLEIPSSSDGAYAIGCFSLPEVAQYKGR